MKTCECGHFDTAHEENGCWADIGDSICPCCISRDDIENGITREFLKNKIASLETDLIHARRVADERQEIIVSLKSTIHSALGQVVGVDETFQSVLADVKKILWEGLPHE